MHSERIGGLLAAWLTEHPAVPGMVVLVRDANGEAHACAGFADRARTEPITVTHAFRIASNTKTFVAAAAMSLVESGTFAPDERDRAAVAGSGAGDARPALRPRRDHHSHVAQSHEWHRGSRHRKSTSSTRNLRNWPKNAATSTSNM